jgi:hypothetical protein
VAKNDTKVVFHFGAEHSGTGGGRSELCISN